MSSCFFSHFFTSSLKFSGIGISGLPTDVTAFSDRLRETIQSRDNAERWISLLRQYTDLTELTAPILNELIEKIVVHEATKGKDGVREQKLDIYYRFVGKIDD